MDDRSDLSAQLHELHMPVLLLWGGMDPISPMKVGQRLAQLIPNAKLEVFPQAGHNLGFTHAAAVARLIDELLSAKRRNPRSQQKFIL
ncbi:alpha/beta hydrolase [Pseudomonas sp. SIMBA_077]